jgi:hypothetical protein
MQTRDKQFVITYKIFNFPYHTWYLIETCKLIDVGRECSWWIGNNLCLSVNSELYHKTSFNRSIERSRWEYFETLNVIDLVHLNTRAVFSNQIIWNLSVYSITLFYILFFRKRYQLADKKYYKGCTIIKSGILIKE